VEVEGEAAVEAREAGHQLGIGGARGHGRNQQPQQATAELLPRRDHPRTLNLGSGSRA
jgi:hypothetical protein